MNKLKLSTLALPAPDIPVGLCTLPNRPCIVTGDMSGNSKCRIAANRGQKMEIICRSDRMICVMDVY